MSNFHKQNSGKKSGSTRKEDKKQVNKALNTALKLAMDGEVAGINHLGKQYFMLRGDKLNELVQNGGRLNLTKDQKEFRMAYQGLLQLMQSVNYEILEREAFNSDEEHVAHIEEMQKNAEVFADLDSFTFEFSEAMGKPKSERSKILEAFNEVLDKHSLTLPETPKPQQPENQGKLT